MGVKVVPLNDQIPVPVNIASLMSQRRIRLQQAKGHIFVVSDDGVLADPVERGHGAQ